MAKVKKTPSIEGIKLSAYLNHWKRCFGKLQDLFERKTRYSDESENLKEIDEQISYFLDEQNALFDLIQQAIEERKKEK